MQEPTAHMTADPSATSDPDSQTSALRPRFWERYPLKDLTGDEWEALCDGCGLCCLFKLSSGSEADCHYTNVACRLLDHQTCRCMHYEHRTDIVADCIVFDLAKLTEINAWLPPTCAYKRLYNGQNLEPWHPLLSGSPETVHEVGVSVSGKVIPEWDADLDTLEHHIMELPS